MLIYFNMFWPNFMSNDSVNYTFFIEMCNRIFNTSCKVSYNIQDADMLIESVFGNMPLVSIKQWKYSILFCGENYDKCYNPSLHPRYTLILSGSTKYPKCIPFPLVIPYMYCNNVFQNLALQTPRIEVPKKLVCTLISNSGGDVRNAFIERLEQRGVHIDHGGRYKNNIHGHLFGKDHSPAIESFVSNYKFMITMENSQEEYYLTEKICHALQHKIIPIYWGSRRASLYVNSERFIQLYENSVEEMDAIIDRMLSMSDSEYLEIVNKPALAQNDMMSTAIESVRSSLAI